MYTCAYKRFTVRTAFHVHLAFKGTIKVRNNIYVQKIRTRGQRWGGTSTNNVRMEKSIDLNVLHMVGVQLSHDLLGGAPQPVM